MVPIYPCLDWVVRLMGPAAGRCPGTRAAAGHSPRASSPPRARSGSWSSTARPAPPTATPRWPTKQTEQRKKAKKTFEILNLDLLSDFFWKLLDFGLNLLIICANTTSIYISIYLSIHLSIYLATVWRVPGVGGWLQGGPRHLEQEVHLPAAEPGPAGRSRQPSPCLPQLSVKSAHHTTFILYLHLS